MGKVITLIALTALTVVEHNGVKYGPGQDAGSEFEATEAEAAPLLQVKAAKLYDADDKAASDRATVDARASAKNAAEATAAAQAKADAAAQAAAGAQLAADADAEVAAAAQAKADADAEAVADARAKLDADIKAFEEAKAAAAKAAGKKS